MCDTANAQAALGAIGEVCLARQRRIPVMLSATVSDSSGRTLAGQTLAGFWSAVADAKPLSIGLNCSPGVHAVRPHLEELARHADCCLSVHPSAGLPDARGEYGVRPVDFANALRDLASSRLVNIVGGCCGTTPDHIAAVVEAVRGITPRAARYRNVITGIAARGHARFLPRQRPPEPRHVGPHQCEARAPGIRELVGGLVGAHHAGRRMVARSQQPMADFMRDDPSDHSSQHLIAKLARPLSLARAAERNRAQALA